MHHPTDRITHTTAFVTPVVEHWLERVQLNSHERLTQNTYQVINFHNIKKEIKYRKRHLGKDFKLQLVELFNKTN